MEAMPGAGSGPGVTMPSFGVVVAGDHLDRLRSHSMPVIARTRGDLTLLDLRSVDPADDDIVVAALRGVGDASM
jgi:L-seryl-tRNA(Ser) seleniumtransferase